VWFEIVGELSDVEVIATGRKLRDRRRLEKHYGKAQWRKVKGTADVRLPDGSVVRAEIHWYEAHGVGKREIKLKRLLA
jgi:hypothetical protein